MIIDTEAEIRKVETILKYKKRRGQSVARGMMRSITKATDIFAVARAMIAKGWRTQLSLRTDMILEGAI